jgi:hypothetical protein
VRMPGLPLTLECVLLFLLLCVVCCVAPASGDYVCCLVFLGTGWWCTCRSHLLLLCVYATCAILDLFVSAMYCAGVTLRPGGPHQVL